MSLREATGSEDRLRSLRELRQVLAAAIDNDPPARDLAALARRLQAVMEEIAGLAGVEKPKESPVDELRRRRASREASS